MLLPCSACIIDSCGIAGGARSVKPRCRLRWSPHRTIVIHPAGGIRHARKRMTQTPGRHLSAVIRSGARLISEWLRPNSRRPPGYSTAGGSLVVQFAILDARATQSVSLELLSSDQVPFCDRADFGGLGEGTGETTSPVWLLRSKVNSLWERGTARPRASWQDLGSRVAAA